MRVRVRVRVRGLRLGLGLGLGSTVGFDIFLMIDSELVFLQTCINISQFTTDDIYELSRVVQIYRNN